MSIWRRAPLTPVEPTWLNLPTPPNVIVPRLSTETLRPDRPSRRYSIIGLHRAMQEIERRSALRNRGARRPRCPPGIASSAVTAAAPHRSRANDDQDETPYRQRHELAQPEL